ncbi:Smr/MutS family protein [Mesorhizobium sp. LHD-90]|uniref:Smr/MutS family protein n=1 Tax=Mesorhizobium sp. LHD-90 TaxID=3071414 RepID=UPI0027DEABA5|nr:Smr/MutS family protein [Mesorhizobium sp. LHD-90]MDQ6434174.1 Smr/MutS family protein [Mesorhizobium sp. LHD-90]
MSRRAEKALTEEDRVLWNLVARSATPLRGRKPVTAPELAPISMAEALAQVTPTEPPRPIAATAAPRRNPLAQNPLDRQTHDKLAAGRLQIEGRVDLHGMTQEEAYGLLLSFLGRAYSNGIRYVLVITGKGSASGGDGVLRRAVPGWLATAPFRLMVSSHDPAARHHGGGGALYVRLRRKVRR